MILGTFLVLAILFTAQGVYRNWDVYRGRSLEYDALPEHLNTQAKIDAAFPDDSQYSGFFGRIYRKFHKITKPWGVFGPRSKFWWARWSAYPRTLFAIGGKGPWRYEYADGDLVFNDQVIFNESYPSMYLSRIQYWKRWHVSVSWPFSITVHAYWRAKDVPVYPHHGGDTTIKDMVYAYGPIHRDGDVVYWLFSFFFGGGWK